MDQHPKYKLSSNDAPWPTKKRQIWALKRNKNQNTHVTCTCCARKRSMTNPKFHEQQKVFLIPNIKVKIETIIPFGRRWINELKI